MKIAIIGGGPIGVEAALYGALAGFDVALFESGPRLAHNIRQWGHVHVFTEWERCRSPLAVRLFDEQRTLLPPKESTPSGDELADYVVALAALPPLKGRIFTGNRVLALTRQACLQSDFIDDPRRAQIPFRLVVESDDEQRVETADVVIDAAGVYATPNPMGSGGAPCPGEIDFNNHIDYTIPDVAGRDRARFAGVSTLVVGSGHSAASTLIAVGELMEEFPDTHLAWAVRRDVPPHGAPYTLIPDDPSPHRNLLHRRANELAKHCNVEFYPRTVVERIERRDGRFRVTLRTQSAGEDESSAFELTVDNIAAHTGFRPDQTLWHELQVDVHPANGATRNMGQALIEQNHRSGVGLSTGYAARPVNTETQVVDKWKFSQNDPQLLQSGEPNFFVIGIKSYGRDAGFLMQNGFRQVRDVYKLISGNGDLDMYDGALSDG